MIKLISIILFFIFSNVSTAQLFLGIEGGIAMNNLGNDNYTTFASEKNIAYLNYKFDSYLIEAIISTDGIKTLHDGIVSKDNTYSYGFLMGWQEKYKEFIVSDLTIGLYKRHYRNNSNSMLNLENTFGATIKSYFGIQYSESFSAGINYRYYYDINKSSKNELHLSQSVFLFTFEINLTSIYRNLNKNQ